MFSLKDLTVEIEQVIEEMDRAKSRDLNPDWVTQAVMDLHPDVDGDDASFYRACARPHVRDAVAKRLNRYRVKAEVAADRQIVMQGFERLQERYLIDIGGTQIARRIEDLTEAQLRAKQNELRAMGAGCYQHAEEIDRYCDERKAAA